MEHQLIRIHQDKLVNMAEKLLVINKVKIAHRAVDVGNYDQLEAAVSSSIKEVGEIDILINNVRLILPT